MINVFLKSQPEMYGTRPVLILLACHSCLPPCSKPGRPLGPGVGHEPASAVQGESICFGDWLEGFPLETAQAICLEK